MQPAYCGPAMWHIGSHVAYGQPHTHLGQPKELFCNENDCSLEHILPQFCCSHLQLQTWHPNMSVVCFTNTFPSDTHCLTQSGHAHLQKNLNGQTSGSVTSCPGSLPISEHWLLHDVLPVCMHHFPVEAMKTGQNTDVFLSKQSPFLLSRKQSILFWKQTNCEVWPVGNPPSEGHIWANLCEHLVLRFRLRSRLKWSIWYPIGICQKAGFKTVNGIDSLQNHCLTQQRCLEQTNLSGSMCMLIALPLCLAILKILEFAEVFVCISQLRFVMLFPLRSINRNVVRNNFLTKALSAIVCKELYARFRNFRLTMSTMKYLFKHVRLFSCRYSSFNLNRCLKDPISTVCMLFLFKWSLTKSVKPVNISLFILVNLLEVKQIQKGEWVTKNTFMLKSFKALSVKNKDLNEDRCWKVALSIWHILFVDKLRVINDFRPKKISLCNLIEVLVRMRNSNLPRGVKLPFSTCSGLLWLKSTFISHVKFWNVNFVIVLMQLFCNNNDVKCGKDLNICDDPMILGPIMFPDKNSCRELSINFLGWTQKKEFSLSSFNLLKVKINHDNTGRLANALSPIKSILLFCKMIVLRYWKFVNVSAGISVIWLKPRSRHLNQPSCLNASDFIDEMFVFLIVML